MTTGIHIFRKDLRTKDNFALHELSRVVDHVIGVFFYDPKQITATTKVYHSERAAQFIVESVDDLNVQCDGKLLTLKEDPCIGIERLIKQVKPVAISFNADYTQYALKRDQAIQKICKQHNVECIVNEDDQTLLPMNQLIKKDGSPYMVYGPFFKLIQRHDIAKPLTFKIAWKKYGKSENVKLKTYKDNWVGGRTEGLRRLRTGTATGAIDDMSATTIQLSAYMNQGCISIREVYWAFKSKYRSIEPIRSIVWRDFLLCIFRFAPNSNSYDKFIEERYNKIKWPSLNKTDWSKFMNCNTGFLLVDAAMAELLKNGFVNNRSRLILATFWTKYLMISPLDKTYGSQVWFSKLLVDCSASQNKMNHQWVVGELDLAGRRFSMKGTHPLTGRMIRVDNQMIKRYDTNFEFIKKWIPEFKDLTIKECKVKVKQIKPMYEWRDRYMEYCKLFEKLPR
jgi:deoxyribodipyrimidine photo-lyase